LARTLDILADLEIDRRDFAQARDRLDEARPHHLSALRMNPRHPDYRMSYRNYLLALARTGAGQGDQTAALEAAAKLRDLGWDPPGNAYDAACALARCVSI